LDDHEEIKNLMTGWNSMWKSSISNEAVMDADATQ